jgi:hypothetical protein
MTNHYRLLVEIPDANLPMIRLEAVFAALVDSIGRPVELDFHWIADGKSGLCTDMLAPLTAETAGDVPEPVGESVLHSGG